MTERWPNLFLVGAMKAGTTTLYRDLDQHPDVKMSSAKEPGFFSVVWDEAEAQGAAGGDDALGQARRDYLALFEGGEDATVWGDASVNYLWHPRAAERLQATVPDARILVSLRDPVKRAYSQQLMMNRWGWDERPLLEAVRAELDRTEGLTVANNLVYAGRYAAQLQAYLDRFPAEHVAVLRFVDLKADRTGTLEAIAGFLDIDPAPFRDLDTGVGNPHREPANRLARWVRRNPVVSAAAKILPRRWRYALDNRVLMRRAPKPPMPAEARELLVATYRPEVAPLERILGERVPWSWVREEDHGVDADAGGGRVLHPRGPPGT